MKKKIALAVGLLLAGLALTACGADANATDTNRGDIFEYTVPLKDGRSVTCLEYRGYKKGGLSCDWMSAR